MAAQNTGTKFPTRPAPSLPVNRTNMVKQNSVESSLSDPFTLLKSQSTKQDRRKPPPRPPPPKLFTSQVSSQRRSIFGSTKKKQQKAAATAIVKPLPPTPNIPVGTLIDLQSPPGSPQFPIKLKSSLSVGNISSYTSNSASLIESGFEDDFNSILSSTATTPGFDPWSTNSDFTPSSSKSPSPDLLSLTQNITTTATSKPDMKSKSFNKHITKNQTVSRPTIICVPSPAMTGGSGITMSSSANRMKPVRPPPPTNTAALSSVKLADDDLAVLTKEGSPPMPCMPPPPPPSDVIQSAAPPVPPRPIKKVDLTEKRPYCLAQYDYDSTHPDDLEFKAGDVISLISEVNEEWLKGRHSDKEGIFPKNYVKIVVPDRNSHIMTVIAVYPFIAETWDDLDLKEGDEIKVLTRINDEWLYGECDGKKGQFPECYTQDISDLTTD